MKELHGRMKRLHRPKRRPQCLVHARRRVDNKQRPHVGYLLRLVHGPRLIVCVPAGKIRAFAGTA